MGSKPDYIVNTATDAEGKEDGHDIGVAFKNGTGTITILLNALPLTNKIVLIPMKEEE